MILGLTARWFYSCCRIQQSLEHAGCKRRGLEMEPGSAEPRKRTGSNGRNVQ